MALYPPSTCRSGLFFCSLGNSQKRDPVGSSLTGSQVTFRMKTGCNDPTRYRPSLKLRKDSVEFSEKATAELSRPSSRGAALIPPRPIIRPTGKAGRAAHSAQQEHRFVQLVSKWALLATIVKPLTMVGACADTRFKEPGGQIHYGRRACATNARPRAILIHVLVDFIRSRP